MKERIDQIERSGTVVINGVRFNVKTRRRKRLTLQATEVIVRAELEKQ